MKQKRIAALATSGVLLLSAFHSHAQEPVQVGYSFNDAPAGTGRFATDYYGTLVGEYVRYNGTWAGGAGTVFPGFSGEEGDLSIRSTGNRVFMDFTSLFPGAWTSFTIEMNIQLSDDPNRSQVLIADAVNYFAVYARDHKVHLQWADPTLETPVLETDTWYHIAFTYDANTHMLNLYLDGEAVDGGPRPPSWIFPAEPSTLWALATSTGGAIWTGLMDDFRLTMAVLTPEEFLYEGFGPHLTAPSAGFTFEDWRQVHFFGDELTDETISGPGANPAGDGISNLLKFVMGLDPKVATRDGLPTAMLEEGQLVLTYSQLSNGAGVELVPEVSTNLVDWLVGPENIEQVLIEEDGGLIHTTVRAIGDASRWFFRIRTSLVE